MDLSYFNAIPTDLFFLVSRELRLDQLFSLARNWPAFSRVMPDQFWNMRFRDQFHRDLPSSAKRFYEKAYKLFNDYMTGKGNVKDMDITSYNTLTSYAPTYIKKINDTSLGYAKGLSLMMELGLTEEAEQFLLKQPDMFTSKYMYIERIEPSRDQPDPYKRIYKMQQTIYSPQADYRFIFEDAGIKAAKNGYLDIIKLLVEYRYPQTNLLAMGAAEGHRIDILNFLHSKYMLAPDYILHGAVKGGHLDLVKKYFADLPLVISHQHLDRELKESTKLCHYDIAKFFIEISHASNPTAFVSTASSLLDNLILGCERSVARNQTINLILSYIALSPGGASHLLETAATIGDIELVDFFVKKGANNLNSALFKATINGRIEVMKYLISKGATMSTYDFQGIISDPSARGLNYFMVLNDRQLEALRIMGAILKPKFNFREKALIRAEIMIPPPTLDDNWKKYKKQIKPILKSLL